LALLAANLKINKIGLLQGVFVEKVTVIQMVKKLPPSYETQKFITALKRACYYTVLF
jgi:hypothetical protein